MIKKTVLVATLCGMMSVVSLNAVWAFNPFEKPSPQPPANKSSIQQRVQENAPPPAPPEPEYETEMVLPPMKASNYRVLGVIDNKYIVVNSKTGNVILWDKYLVKNNCTVLDGEVKCYEKKKIRVR